MVPGSSSASETIDRRSRIHHTTAAKGTSSNPIGLSTEIKTNTMPSKVRHVRLCAGSASKTRHASNPKCHCRFVAFASVPYVFGRPKYTKLATNRFHKGMPENREETKIATGSI